MGAAKSILIVEDEQYLLDLYVQILKPEGYAIDTADNGQSAYLKMKDGGYDLVLLDIMMPEMDGIQVLEKLQKEGNPLGGSKNVLLLTNLGQDGLIAKALDLNVRSYLVKSDYTPEQLLTEIRRYVN